MRPRSRKKFTTKAKISSSLHILFRRKLVTEVCREKDQLMDFNPNRYSITDRIPFTDNPLLFYPYNSNSRCQPPLSILTPSWLAPFQEFINKFSKKKKRIHFPYFKYQPFRVSNKSSFFLLSKEKSFFLSKEKSFFGKKNVSFLTTWVTQFKVYAQHPLGIFLSRKAKKKKKKKRMSFQEDFFYFLSRRQVCAGVGFHF